MRQTKQSINEGTDCSALKKAGQWKRPLSFLNNPVIKFWILLSHFIFEKKSIKSFYLCIGSVRNNTSEFRIARCCCLNNHIFICSKVIEPKVHLQSTLINLLLYVINTIEYIFNCLYTLEQT